MNKKFKLLTSTTLAMVLALSISSMGKVNALDNNTFKAVNTNIAMADTLSNTVTITASSTSISKYGTVTISGYVKDVNGNPLANTNIAIMEGSRYIDNRWTDANGYYYSPNIPGEFLGTGSHTLNAYICNKTESGKYMLTVGPAEYLWADVMSSPIYVYVSYR